MGLKEMPVKSAKHIRPPIEGSVNHWVVVGIGKDHRLPDHYIDELRDPPQKIDMLFHLLLTQPVASQQPRIPQHSRRLVQDELRDNQLVRAPENRVEDYTGRSSRFGVRSNQNSGIQHHPHGRRCRI
jgi:hypothetical protein